MNPTTLVFIALGGAVGSVARAVAGYLIPAGRLPWGTVAVNIVGSFVIGCLIARLPQHGELHLRAHGFWVVGVCGGFTTFSTFSWQTIEQMQKGNWGSAAMNVVLSVVLCLLATWLGWRLMR